MRKLTPVVMAVVAALYLAGVAGASEQFKAKLTGDQEAPIPVDTDTTGSFSINFNKTLTSAEFVLAVADGQRVTQAHLHCGPAGVAGPIVVFLAGLISTGIDVDGKWVHNVTITDANIINPACGATLADLVASIRAGNVYANVHTLAHTGGEVRGQLQR